MARAHVLVSGKVQGVFYRDATRQEAEARGVRGWVRNLPDGRVEALFDGERETVEGLVAWCRKGPPLARVADVEVAWREEEEPLSGFAILPTPRRA